MLRRAWDWLRASSKTPNWVLTILWIALIESLIEDWF